MLDEFSDVDESSLPALYTHTRPADLRKLCERLGWNFFDSYFKFTTTRNPWDRLVSVYEMIRREEEIRRGGWRRRIPGARVPAFPKWLRTVRVDRRGGGAPWKRGALWRRYGTYSLSAFAADENGRELVDQVLRLEDLEEDLPRVFASLGVPRRDLIPRVGQTRERRDYRDYYDEGARERVGTLYAQDITRFGYRFD